MGKFKLGSNKPDGSGRVKGNPNKKTLVLHEVLAELGVDVPQRLIKLLPHLKKEQQAEVLLELMPYLYTKRNVEL